MVVRLVAGESKPAAWQATLWQVAEHCDVFYRIGGLQVRLDAHIVPGS